MMHTITCWLVGGGFSALIAAGFIGQFRGLLTADRETPTEVEA